MGGSVIYILLATLILLGILARVLSLRKGSKDKQTPSFPNPDPECCGAHDICEKDSLLSSSSQIEYFEDEELDNYIERPEDTYQQEEVEEFREVLLTLREQEVAAWLKSLQLRNIKLPVEVRDEALLIVSELRESPTK